MKGILITIGILFALVILLVPISDFAANQAFKRADRPWAPGVAYTCGRIMVLATSYKNARTVLEKVTTTWPLYPNRERRLFLIGLCFEKENDMGKAKECYKYFLQYYPNDELAVKTRKRLDDIEAIGQ